MTLFITVFCALVSISVVKAQRVQLINASSDAGLTTIDVYLDGNLWLDNFAVNTGTAMADLTPNTPITIAVAPASSTSSADALYANTYFIAADKNYIFTVIGNTTDLTQPVTIVKDDAAREFGVAPDMADISWIHAAAGAPALNVVVRFGLMIVGGLEYGQVTPYQSLAAEEIYVDVKAVGTTDIIATYRLSLNAEAGNALKILVTGSAANSNSLKLYAVYPYGFTTPLDVAPLGRVQYISALADTVDIYKNGTRFADNAIHGMALPFKNIPAGINMNIAICDSTSITADMPISVTPFTFQNALSYTAISAGARGNSDFPPKIFIHAGSLETATDSNLVSLLFFQGDFTDTVLTVTDETGAVLFDQVHYGTFAGYKNITPGPHAFKITNALTNEQVYKIDLIDYAPLKGHSVTLFTTDEIRGASHSELWQADATGSSALLPFTSGATTGLFAEEAIRIFPNPAQNAFFIQHDTKDSNAEFTYTITDMLGHTIQSGTYRQSGAVEINTRSLAAGTYLLAVHTAQQHITKRINIQR